MINIRKLEAELWESADLLRAGSKLTSNQYCMPVLGLIFLRYAYSRFKMVEAEIMKSRPSRGGRVIPVEPNDFTAKSALYLPKEAQYEYLLNLPENIAAAGIVGKDGNTINSLGEAVNNAMQLIEDQSSQLKGVLPRSYTDFSDEILSELLRIFNNSALDEIGGDIIGRIYEYFLNKFAKNIASDDGVFFTPKSLVKMIVNIIEPKNGVLLDPACGSGGMFIQSGDFVNHRGMNANNTMTFYGQEKVAYNAQLCLMNMAVHGLNGVIKSGDEANSFYYDAHNLDRCCDYVMANPPFNVDKVKAEACASAQRLPFGLPGVNKSNEVGNANYLWISYFYSYLNERGRAGFVMASSATDSQGKDRDIREKLVETGHVDVMVSVGNNFFYTKSLPCSLWFFDKGKAQQLQDTVLFIDARNYYTVVDRTLNEWSEWQLKNLNAIVWLYRGEKDNYSSLLQEYQCAAAELAESFQGCEQEFADGMEQKQLEQIQAAAGKMQSFTFEQELTSLHELQNNVQYLKTVINDTVKNTLETYSAMGKADYKAYQQEFLAAYNRKLDNLPKVKKLLNSRAEACQAQLDELVNLLTEAEWLYSKFGEGEYQDVQGLCKAASLAEIREKNYSLTPGAYVGVAPTEDDGVDFTERMKEIHRELLELQAESNRLMQTISKNWEELGL